MFMGEYANSRADPEAVLGAGGIDAVTALADAPSDRQSETTDGVETLFDDLSTALEESPAVSPEVASSPDSTDQPGADAEAVFAALKTMAADSDAETETETDQLGADAEAVFGALKTMAADSDTETKTKAEQVEANHVSENVDREATELLESLSD